MATETKQPEMKIAIIAITRNGSVIGKKLLSSLNCAELHVSARYACESDHTVRSFEPTALKEVLNSLWNRVDGFIFIMSTGIVVRLVAPLLRSKSSDPAITVMDDQGRFSISLLSGHLGGANELTERCAAITGSSAVITTATDAAGLPSFDMLAKEMGWGIDNICHVKNLNTLLLDNRQIAVVDHSGHTRKYFQGRGNLSFHDSIGHATESMAEGYLFVTSRQLAPEEVPANALILRPRNLVLGIGCNRGTSMEEIELFVTLQMHQLQLCPECIQSIATAEAKSDEDGLIAYAKKVGIPLKLFSSTELNRVVVTTPPSRHALDAIGATGVAEPAAILASGGGRLLLNKVKTKNLTLAVAELKSQEV